MFDIEVNEVANSDIFNNLGLVTEHLGNFNEALEYYY